MGANIGTSVTNTLASLGHVRQGAYFERALAAATMHDYFNLLTVLLLLPLAEKLRVDVLSDSDSQVESRWRHPPDGLHWSVRLHHDGPGVSSSSFCNKKERLVKV